MKINSAKKILIILGPTATGKTDLALKLAKEFNGELVACDSRQIYKGLDIGTGKLPRSGKWEVRRGNKKWEIGGIKIWMYDVVSPKIQYTVADYIKDANKVLENIRERGKLPIVVGGTGLYLKALLEGLDSLAVPVDKKLRRNLERLSLKELQERLQQVSAERWESMNISDRQNPRRLVRAIEFGISPGRSPFGHLPGVGYGYGNDILRIGLTAPREVLYQRVDDRVVSRIKQGMIEEAKRLYKNGLSFNRMKQLGLEYGVLADYLEDRIKSIDELVKIMQYKIHGYVRRQLTWFKREKNVSWFDITTSDYLDKIEKLTSDWYNHRVNATKN